MAEAKGLWGSNGSELLFFFLILVILFMPYGFGRY